MLKNKKGLILAALLIATLNSLAANGYPLNKPGFYLGVQKGYSAVHYPQHFYPGYYAHSTKGDGIATRVYGGFDLNHYLAMEFGVAYFYQPKFIGVNYASWFTGITKNNIVFLWAKAMWPINPQWTLYGNLGIGYIARSSFILNKSNHWIVFKDREIPTLTYGMGTAYLLWPRWSMDLTWLHAPKQANDYLPASNLIAIGIRYKFS
jgi:opacity protein-like surface antigen